MRKFSVVVEQITYLPLFKTFEADTEEEAAALAQADIDRADPVADRNGWVPGDSSIEFEVRPGSTAEFKEGQ